MSTEHEDQRLQQVRRRLSAQADRLMREYAWLRLEGLHLYQQLWPAPGGEPASFQAGQHFLAAYERLEAEHAQFQTACEHYLRESLHEAHGPLCGGGEQLALHA